MLMLVCFGAAWPFSIHRSWKSKQTGGKSVVFLYVILLGYASGLTHKILYSRDGVTWLYAINGAMVLADILLYHRNIRLARVAASQRPA